MIEILPLCLFQFRTRVSHFQTHSLTNTRVYKHRHTSKHTHFLLNYPYIRTTCSEKRAHKHPHTTPPHTHISTHTHIYVKTQGTHMGGPLMSHRVTSVPPPYPPLWTSADGGRLEAEPSWCDFLSRDRGASRTGNPSTRVSLVTDTVSSPWRPMCCLA